MPGGGVDLSTDVGGVPCPSEYWLETPAILAIATTAAAATVPLSYGVMTC